MSVIYEVLSVSVVEEHLRVTGGFFADWFPSTTACLCVREKWNQKERMCCGCFVLLV